MARLAAALALGAVAACTRSEPIAERSPHRRTPTAVERAADRRLPDRDAAEAASPGADAGPPREPLPEAFRRLGLPCERSSSPEWRRSRWGPVPPFGEQCATGRVAAIYEGVYAIPRAPPAAARLLASEGPLDPEIDHGESYAAIEGSRLWVRFVTCGTCRVFLGWSLLGDVEWMSDGQLLDLQRVLGVEGAAPLRTGDAWSRQRIRLPPPR